MFSFPQNNSLAKRVTIKKELPEDKAVAQLCNPQQLSVEKLIQGRCPDPSELVQFRRHRPCAGAVQSTANPTGFSKLEILNFRELWNYTTSHLTINSVASYAMYSQRIQLFTGNKILHPQVK